MRVELGTPVVLVAGVNTLWHIPVGDDELSEQRTLCGLNGLTYVFGGVVRERRLCSVCAKRAPADVYQKEVGLLPPPGRKRGRPKGKYVRFTPVELEVIYRVYVSERVSLRAIAESFWRQRGYSTVIACSNALHRQLTAAGYELRTVGEALALRNHKHGRKSRSVSVGPENAAYRRWLKATRGLYEPRCAGVKTGANGGKGRPCQRPAVRGSDFCPAHDPAKRARREATLARMRQLSPSFPFREAEAA